MYKIELTYEERQIILLALTMYHDAILKDGDKIGLPKMEDVLKLYYKILEPDNWLIK